MTCPTTGRHPDDRVAGHNGQGILTWRCAGCGRHQYRKPVRDYPPEIAPNERLATATRREEQGEGSGPVPVATVYRWATNYCLRHSTAYMTGDFCGLCGPYRPAAPTTKPSVRDYAAIEREWTGEPNPKSFTMPCGLHDRARCEECRP